MNPALEYAEKYLGVHKVQEEAERLLDELNASLDALDAAQDARRELDEKISDHEMDILISERGKHPDHSEAAMSRHLKEIHHKDLKLRRLRHERNAKSGEASGLELDIEYTKYRLKVKVARMEELGGYFQYLAAVKNAEPPPVQYAEAGTSTGLPEATSGETNKAQQTGEPQ